MEAEHVDYALMLEGLKRHETESFELFINTYSQKIFRYCYYMLGHRQEAEDAAQDIIIKVYDKIHTYRAEDNFNAWVYKIAYHYCLGKKRREQLFSKIMRVVYYSAEETGRTASPDEISDELLIPLLKLKPEERNLIILRVVEQKSYEELGQMLHASPAAVRKQFERARNRLRKYVEQKEAYRHEKPYSIL